MSSQRSRPAAAAWLQRFRQDCVVNAALTARLVLLGFRLGSAAVHGGYGPRASQALWLVHRLLYMLALPLGSEIDPRAEIGERFSIPHSGKGLIVSGHVRVGDDVMIYHQVTIGNNDPSSEVFGAPRIGSRVTIYPGARVVGAITVGDDCVVGANAVVLTDVAPGSTAVGVPARILPRRDQPRAAE